MNWWKSLKHLDSDSVGSPGFTFICSGSSAGTERIFSSFVPVRFSKLRNPLGPDEAGKLVFSFPEHEQTRTKMKTRELQKTDGFF